MSYDMRDILIHFSIKYEGDFGKIYSALASHERCSEEEIKESLDQVEKNVVTILDEQYPDTLKGRNCPPIVMYYSGNLDLMNKDMEILVNPQDSRQRFFTNAYINTRTGVVDYVIGCENQDQLDPLCEYLFDHNQEVSFENYFEETLDDDFSA